jgi:hypothetical protein
MFISVTIASLLPASSMSAPAALASGETGRLTASAVHRKQASENNL